MPTSDAGPQIHSFLPARKSIDSDEPLCAPCLCNSAPVRSVLDKYISLPEQDRQHLQSSIGAEMLCLVPPIPSSKITTSRQGAMPFYFYHLKFELYPSPTPTSKASVPTATRDEIWLPPRQTDVFGDLPSSHAGFSLQSTRPIPGSDRREYLTRRSQTSQTGNQTSVSNIIECGTPRGPIETSSSEVGGTSGRKSLRRTPSSPPPPAGAALEPQTAVNDWRFGRVSIVTIDHLSMSGEPSRTGVAGSAAPSLGPTFGGTGTLNRAELLHVRTKHTELGWGIVHFYRDGEETPSLGSLAEEAGDLEKGSEQLDCTTVCIPAVPSYMSPGDFLGFVGEKWRSDISHCRMVMTSNMSKYLTLLKFRDGDRAKKWRREFDGKVFNTMEVSTSASFYACSWDFILTRS